MKNTISVKSIMWRHQANKDGAFPVRIRITKNRKSKYKTIPNLVATEVQWKTMEPVLDLLIEHLSSVNDAMKEVQEDRARHEFFEYAWKWRERYNNEKNTGFYKMAKAIINKFKEFIGDRPLYFHEITHSIMLDYQAWLKQRVDKKGKPVNVANTRSQAIKKLRMIFRSALKEKLIPADLWPFDGLKLEKNDTIKMALSKQQMQAIRKLKLTPDSDLWHHRNIFLFCFNALGMRISDCLKMKAEHVRGGRILYAMGKSGDIINLTQTPEAVRILSYYSNRDPNDYLFPILEKNKSKTLYARVASAEAQVNKGLKKIANEAKIDIKLSTHISRHTWGEIAMKMGVNMKIIQQAFGHESMDTTENYTKGFSNKAIDDANRKVTSG